MANSTSIPEIMGPGFFIFFQVDSPGSSGQLKRPRFNRVSTVTEDKPNEDDEAIALAILMLFCND